MLFTRSPTRDNIEIKVNMERYHINNNQMKAG